MSKGTERMTMGELAASGGLANLRSSATGTPLRAIAEAAIAAQEKAQGEAKPADAAPTKGEDSQKAPKRKSEASIAPSTSRFRFVIGIDPGVKTGIAIWDRESSRLVMVETMDFWGVMLPLVCDIDNLLPGNVIRNTNTEFVVEIAHYAPTFRERRGKATSVGTADRMSRNVGGVTREAQLLVAGLRACGYTVTERRPIGKAKRAADDVEQFERQTGWTERTSQHARDAARLCFQG